MIVLWAILVSISALLLLFSFCRLIYKHCLGRQISPVPWILLSIFTTPVIGAAIYTVNCRSHNCKMDFHRYKGILLVIVVALLLLVVSSILLAVDYNSLAR